MKSRFEAIVSAIGDGISIQDTNFRVLYQNQVHKDGGGVETGDYCFSVCKQHWDLSRLPGIEVFQ
jgi:hypothetical protein